MFSNWYYYQDGQNDLAGPVDGFSKAGRRTLESIGTIAIGALIIAIATSLRVLIGWFAGKTREITDQNFIVRWFI